jgi:uncharacterized iron-regulated membrane protein
MIEKKGRAGRVSGRNLWFQIHKWLGLLLLLLLIPIGVSGSLLVWDEWTDGIVNPQRYEVSDGRVLLPAAAYLDAARESLAPGDRIVSISFPAEAGRPVMVMAAPATKEGDRAERRSSQRWQLWLDPATARVLDKADSRSGLVRTMHVLHGSLLIPGWGRTVVGWLGVAMLVSSLTGLWLWLPSVGSLARALRWGRSPLISANLHHQVGFWIALPLAILSFTGAWISFPNVFGGLERLVVPSSAPPARDAGPDRRAAPVAATRLSADDALGAAGVGPAPGGTSLRWPTEKRAAWSITTRAGGRTVQLSVDDATGKVAQEQTPGGGGARFMRTLHDGNGYNPVWQTIIFLGGLAPAILGVTGTIMWARTRSWRARASRRPAAAAAS